MKLHFAHLITMSTALSLTIFTSCGRGEAPAQQKTAIVPEAPATITFPSDISRSPMLSHQINSGEKLQIVYKGERLEKCTAMNRGAQSFFQIYFQIDGGEIKSHGFGVFGDKTLVIETEPSQREVKIWAHNYAVGLWPCDAWDSNFGQNHKVPLL